MTGLPGVGVVVSWWDTEPPAASVRELETAVGTVPVAVQLSPDLTSASFRVRVRAIRARTRRRSARWARRTARRMVQVRGLTRPARLLVRVAPSEDARRSHQRALRALRLVLPETPLLLVATDGRSAAVAWELSVERRSLVSVLGLPAAVRFTNAVASAGVPWENWDDVVCDVDPDHVYAALPGLRDGTLLAPRELRDTAPGPVAVPQCLDGPTALLLGPANYAGMGAAWARTVGTHLAVLSSNLAVVKADGPYAFAADHPVTSAEWGLRAVRERLCVEAIGPATHVLLEALRPLVDVDGTATSAWDFAAGARDARALCASGRTVGLLLHGSESRRPAVHADLYAHSPFLDRLDDPAVARLVEATDTVHALLAELPDLPRFVSTPDMLDFVPGATWLPNVVRFDAFVPGVEVLTRPRPVVLHAPSSALLKGSDVVDRVLGDLHEDGVLEYRRLRDVPPGLVAGHVRDADLVVDQVHLGNIGVLTLEAMASGRVVLAHAIAQVLARYDEPVPLATVAPDTLREVVLRLLGSPDEARALAAAGPGFVRRHHDGRRSAAVLCTFLGL